jgi:hypothetical protein
MYVLYLSRSWCFGDVLTDKREDIQTTPGTNFAIISISKNLWQWPTRS